MQALLDRVIEDSAAALQALQKPDGRWEFDLEADVTIPAEYILLNHYLDEIEPEIEAELGAHIRGIEGAHGGWPLFHGGGFDLSASVKGYFALKMIGDPTDAPHMARARQAILAAGGAERANVFTRYQLALYGEAPWRAVPVMPVELLLMPRWFPVTVARFSYWSRTVITPLLILAALKPQARNPRGVHIGELFTRPPAEIRDWQTNPTGSWAGKGFLLLDRLLRLIEPWFPKHSRQKAIDRALSFITERLNGEDGLGAIYPAMANAVMAFDALGHPKGAAHVVTAKRAVKKLISADQGKPRFIQPCISPIWDTGLAAHALLEAGVEVKGAWDWLKDRQILDVAGDWAWKRPDLAPGGWAFQNRNDHYPDVDDTAVVAMALDRADRDRHRLAVERAAQWIIGMQSANGGWGAFDVDNNDQYLNAIPFADHGALLDPPTADVSARCLGLLAQLGMDMSEPVLARTIAYLKAEQERDGSWYGRWGTNYIYGTWSVLVALRAAGEDMHAPYVRRAVAWLLTRQRGDGGWGEDGASYWPERKDEQKASTASQTAWALLGLMAAGESKSEAVARGVTYLLHAPREGSKWIEPEYTAVGFPRVFYLRYDGYSRFFPLQALARYRNLVRGNAELPGYGL